MLSRVYNLLATLFYFYLAYRGIDLVFFQTNEEKYQSVVYQYGLENKYAYLSIWVSALQTQYFVIGIIVDLIERFPTVFKCQRWLQYLNPIRHYLLTSIVLPLTLYIFIVFWAFYLYDREMIYPELFDRFIPPWLNHALHSFPIPIFLGHMLISPNVNPSMKSAFVGLTLLFVVYGVVFAASVVKGNWVYLVFNSLTPSQRILILSVSYPFTILLMVLSRGLNSYIRRFKEKNRLKESKVK